MKTGLTLGKFAPLHKGHQFVIETALNEVDQLIVLIYDCPDIETLPLPVRAGWIRKLYPTAEVIEAWDGPTETGLEPRITQMHDEYLLKILNGKQITHFFSSEAYGEHVSLALKSKHCLVDLDRKHVPISGTAIRSNPFTHRSQMDPLVYKDHISKLVFLGAPSTGKSTIVEALAERYETVMMPEYGREYWEANQIERRLSQKQLVEIATGHVQREEKLLMDANRYLFVDTDASTTLQFARYYHGYADEALLRMADEAKSRYDLFFLCEPDIPYDDTWDRSGEASRNEMHRRIEADLLARKVPFVRLAGALAERMVKVESVLKSHRLFQPIFMS
ncbi:MAG: AAA family ATPase [Pirellula sp.]|jgi:NadR type nicotinamide-nucleotide adenylyltransferase|nr:AAA family ATPase [Pirellula sp.]